MSDELVPVEVIENRIFIIRGHKVMLDRDLAFLYGIETFTLNRAVKRNIKRFPEDFMFSLSREEIMRIYQFGISSENAHRSIKFAKNVNVFTEYGILMLSSVLNSDRAVAVNIQIMRTFSKLRKMFIGYKDLKEKIDQMEAKYDGQFKEVFEVIKQLMDPAGDEKPMDVGFKP